MTGKRKTRRRRLLRIPKPRSVEAHALELGQFRHKVVECKVWYTRKYKHKEVSDADS
jgi:hypothetical protein